MSHFNYNNGVMDCRCTRCEKAANKITLHVTEKISIN